MDRVVRIQRNFCRVEKVAGGGKQKQSTGGSNRPGVVAERNRNYSENNSKPTLNIFNGTTARDKSVKVLSDPEDQEEQEKVTGEEEEEEQEDDCHRVNRVEIQSISTGDNELRIEEVEKMKDTTRN